MALVVEDGTGIPGADAYASRAFVLAYWVDRPQSSFAATVASADVDNLDGAIRESTSYLDAQFAQYYRGVRAGYVQGREFPRADAYDDAGFPLQGLPVVLQHAVCELAARAISGPLSSDAARGGRVKRNTVVGAVEQEYFDGATPETKYGVISGMLYGILDGTQGGNPDWAWR